MAGELVNGIIQSTVDKLSSLLPPPSTTSSSSATSDADLNDLRRLERIMNRIQTLLIEAGSRDIRDLSENHRLKELKEVALDAEDLVEDYAYEVTHAKLLIRNSMLDEWKSGEVTTDLSSIVVFVALPEEMAVRVRAIRERFDEIVKVWESLRWIESDGARRLCFETRGRQPSGSMVHEPFIYGRNHDKEIIIETLLKEDVNNQKNGGNLCVLPIVGMGGVGKTTLAQLVYNDPRVSQYFDLKGWVWVWENFDVTTVTENIILSLTKKPCGPMHLDALQINLQETLKGKKMLLVLDDVWNERGSLWDSLRAPLFNSSLSKVIVTTRNEKVAKIMQTIPFYPLCCLSTEDSWKLFKQVVFKNQDPGENANLVEIGRKITKKCGGLPLAVKAIGCALRFELDQVWEDILESELWESEAGKNEVLPALQLSYNCMPMHLKQCFMFLSLFPKDFVFVKDKIIKLWAALGIFQSKSKKSIKNNIGSVYFDDLQQRSMVQKVQYDEKNCNYVVHDLMHKLAEIEAGELFARVDVLNSFSSKVVRYLTVMVNDLPKAIDLIPIQQLNSLRVLQVLNAVNKWMSKDIGINFHRGFFENLKYLRALDFSYTGITNLPDSIGHLKQLRYLGLTETNIKHLPDTICLLYNLQTLDLLGCPLQMLPRGIFNLVMLQHLNIEKWSSVPTPYGIGHLTNLVTLPAFNMNEHSSCKISELRNLKCIQGELCITGLDNVRHISDVRLADLKSKKQINCLTLDWSSNASKTQNRLVNAGVVMEVLRPHENLQELEIYRYPGLSYPRWLGRIFYRGLVRIVLFGNREIGCTFLPSLGRLRALRNLSIQCMLNVECVGHEFCGCNGIIKGFRSINSLEFKYMPRWVQWFGIENGEFCSLNSLKIVRCDALRFMPFQLSSSLTKLVLNHCKELINLPILPSLTSLILMGRLHKYFFINLISPSLKSLELGFSQNIRLVPLNFLALKSLEVLVIKGCKNLESIVGLYNFTSLKELELDDCPCLKLSENQRFPPLLQVLKITNCPQLDEQVNFGHKKIDNAINEEWEAHEYDDISHEYEDISRNEEPPWNDLWGDSNDYKFETWLSTRISQSQQSKDQPTTSRKRDRDDILKEFQNSFDRGKQMMGYSSGSSCGGKSDSELGSYGGTSEEEYGL